MSNWRRANVANVCNPSQVTCDSDSKEVTCDSDFKEFTCGSDSKTITTGILQHYIFKGVCGMDLFDSLPSYLHWLQHHSLLYFLRDKPVNIMLEFWDILDCFDWPVANTVVSK